jgi:hypothetical protein
VSALNDSSPSSPCRQLDAHPGVLTLALLLFFRSGAGPPGAAIRLPCGRRARADAAPAVPQRQGHICGSNFLRILADLLLWQDIIVNYVWVGRERLAGEGA